jgi:hypothetical protein
MQVDTHGLDKAQVGKRMRVELADGELLETRLQELTVDAKLEPCCAIAYVLISTDRSDGKRDPGAAYWTAFGKIEVLGD